MSRKTPQRSLQPVTAIRAAKSAQRMFDRMSNKRPLSGRPDSNRDQYAEAMLVVAARMSAAIDSMHLAEEQE